MGESDLIPRHGGYRRLKSFQLAELIYDVTVRFGPPLEMGVKHNGSAFGEAVR